MELHGRQFIAGPRAVERENLGGREIFGTLQIGYHKRLPVTKVERVDRELVALGHVIDPARPASGNRDVLASLAACTTFDQLESAMAALGGRWLLFARIEDAARLYPDAGGSKSAFYSDGWVASQPGLFGHPIDHGLSAHPKACTWPMGETPFEGVRQLLPNHYLELTTFRAIRFGPRPVVNAGLEAAAELISDILKGTLEAVTFRGTAALPITGGVDSRTLLSSAYELLDNIKLITVVDEKVPRPDYVIPKILAKLVRHPVRFVQANEGEDVSANTCGLWRDPSQHRLPSFAQADFVLLGHLSEICRCFYWKDGSPRQATPELLSRIAGFDGAHQDIYARWLEGVPTGCGIDSLDFFYWESRAGTWSSLCCLAMDGFCDVISPYNCRRLIETGLAVDVAYRREPWELHRRLCRPELRSVPFNATRLEQLDAFLGSWIPWRARALIKRLGYLIEAR